MMNEVQTIKTFFDSHQVLLSLEWLESCIQWCRSELLGPNYAITDLQFKVYEQWLLLDLREVELKALPPNISTQKKYTLNGIYSLQVIKIVDISKPKLWQIQKIRNTNALSRNQEKDNEEAGIGKRVLLVTMTDGVQEIEGMEYKPLPALNINSRPGIKVRLMGPITVRRGRLMLEPQHIKVLGGEVEEIVVSNAAENILARALGLPENPTPTVIDESILTANTDIFNQSANKNTPKPFTATNFNKTNTNIPKNTSNQKKIEDDFPNDAEMNDFMLDQEMDMLMEAERDMERSTKTKIPPQRKVKTPDMFDDDFEDFNEEEIIKNAIKIKTSQKSTKTPQKQTKTTKKPAQLSQTLQEEIQNNFDDLNDLFDDVFGDFNIDVHLDQAEILNIKKLHEFFRDKKFGTFKVKAKFNSIVKKLTVANDELHLVIKIEDSTGDISVRVHSKIIAGFAGYTPAAFMALKENVTKKDESATLKVIKALKEIKNKLIKLEGTLEIKLENNVTDPILIEIL
ncbi:unnamed protein product [Brassicogethes aeneus]|uniref:RecQ-mediated genome instability protein 1 n=1 Tax=Brassicogethes aeneus TaxID=1431903 RepID=A0A9P0FEZ3_BRAAE|nr:unnamed protein product [Brassicogethes aeneus]